jgi:hypothetical protein
LRALVLAALPDGVEQLLVPLLALCFGTPLLPSSLGCLKPLTS